MLPFLPLLLLGVSVDGTVDAHHPEAVEVYSCAFDTDTDINHDRWPDYWKRQRGPDHPTYLKIGIVKTPTLTDKHCLQIDMNAGSAGVHSPPIPISPLFSYVLEVDLKTEELRHSKAYVSACYYNAENEMVDVAGVSPVATGTQDWSRIRMGPFSTNEDGAAYVVISLHVEPKEGKFDLHGFAQFDNIWFARLPRMTLQSNSPHNVYSDGKQVEITCLVSGIQQRDPMVTFELIDLSSRTLAEMNNRLDGQVVALSSNRIAELTGRDGGSVEKSENGYQGKMSWRPPLDGYGFYRVRVRMLGKSGVMHEREISLVVVQPRAPPTGGEFGWSLPEGDAQLPLGGIADLLKQVGANWVKFPIWYDGGDRERADKLAQFIEQLNTNRIELVGIVDQPPAEARKRFSESQDRLPAASVFAERDIWYPALNPVLTRLSLKIQSWQLGADDDTSFMGHAELAEKISEVDTQIEQLGQKIDLGFSWRWLSEMPNMKNPPWRFLSLSSNPEMTADELATYLQRTDSNNAQRWVMLQPLARGDYPVHERARDLVLRMLAAKMNHADITFATNPFDPRTGLMKSDGTPGELLLPWRTTAYMISGTQHLGTIKMPGGSRNYILTRGDQAIMVIWNEKETEEVINLGDPSEIQHVDLWGRVKKPKQQQHRQVYQIGPMPTFITGVSREMALWRMEFDFLDPKLESMYGRPQLPRFRMKNPFRQGAIGTMQVRTPKSWGNLPLPIRVNMSGNEDRTDHVEITLRNNASSGEEPVRVDFEITADRDYQFSAWRKLEVGLGDVVMEFRSRLDESGNLIVEQKMINKTDSHVNFKCFLFPPGRRRVRQNVLDLGRGTRLKVYSLPEGEELLGQTLWARAEEIYGNRVLNYRFTAKAE